MDAWERGRKRSSGLKGLSANDRQKVRGSTVTTTMCYCMQSRLYTVDIKITSG